MDWNTLAIESGAIIVIVGLVIWILMTPWHTKWRCGRCGEEFVSEAEAKGHQMIHGEHRVAPMPEE